MTNYAAGLEYSRPPLRFAQGFSFPRLSQPWQWPMIYGTSLLNRTTREEKSMPKLTDADVRKLAEAILDFLQAQTYQGEPLLHAIVCCDFVSRMHMIDSLMRIIERETA
jgi:hypothetical protein